MSEVPSEAPPLAGPPVRAELLAHVRAAIAALETLGDGPGSAARCTELLRATREVVAGLAEARAKADQSAAGRIHGYRSLLHRILEVAARRPVRLAFHATPFASEWTDLLLEAALVSDYTVGVLFLDRARSLGDRTLFLLPPDRKEARVSWKEAERRVLEIGRALLALRARAEVETGRPVAMLGANSTELAIFDLACLVTGTTNVPVPANSTPAQVTEILTHAKPGALFLGDAQGRALWAAAKTTVPRLHWITESLDADTDVASFRAFLDLGAGCTDEEVRNAASAVRSTDLATVMYTSGTTGSPKAVPFTQGNLITKRFARAAAWPDLGEGDVFLCYLPLYHTFGRWLEMLGCAFWGAIYAFVDDVSVESLLWSFRRVRPTTFISVPKKWIQIAEAVAPLAGDAEADPDRDRAVARALVEATGGRLRRGLSAAGYLPAPVFRRFHSAGIELHSGFGMTEATGGITMTPAGDYRDDSIGVALPGIELKIADDGELLIRGPYVTPPTSEEPPRVDGWLASGDIVVADPDRHLRIIDRKKEIFKNVQGETISPRRIESLFSGFDAVERVLLVGDGREYCTVLIVPSAELREAYAHEASGSTLDSPQLRELFAPIVSTVNRFLAPYERLVDFAILSRDLDAERGELTAKGTPKRKLLAERFQDAIEPMYSRESLALNVGGLTVRLPNWFLRQTGIHAREVRAAANALEVATTGRRLVTQQVEGGVLVGDLVYTSDSPELLVGEIFGRAELWLGNDEVRKFAGTGIAHWWRRGRRFRVGTRLLRRPLAPEDAADDLPRAWASDTGLDIDLLHELTRSLRHPDVEVRRSVVELLRDSMTGDRPETDLLVRDVLASGLADAGIRGECLRALLPVASAEELDGLVTRHLADAFFLSDRDVEIAAGAPLRPDQLDRLLERLRELAEDETAEISRTERLVRWVVRHAVEHRDSHVHVRSALAALSDDVPGELMRALLREQLGALVQGFRARLPHLRLALGVAWKDVIEFKGELPLGSRERIQEAIARSTLLPEARTLLGPEATPSLPPLGRGSIRISYLGEGTGRTVHLLEWHGPGPENEASRFECILKLNHAADWDDVQRELRLAVRVRAGSARPIVKAHGGGYRDWQLWTEEYVPGLTLDRLVERLLREKAGDLLEGLEAPGGRLPEVWPFLVSACASLVVEFWRRTGRRHRLARPNPAKVVLPEHDWQVGGRLVSVADRIPCSRLTDVLDSIHRYIVHPLEERHREIALPSSWSLLFSAALEVLGEKEGMELLEAEAPWSYGGADLPGPTPELPRDGERMGPAALRFVSSVKRRGFLPTRIRMAARRWRRWEQLNPSATLEAQATTLDQFVEAYGLADLESERPGTTLQLFRHTVFRGAGEELAAAIDELIAKTVTAGAAREEWRPEVARLRERLALDDRQEFFLARMIYPHVDPRGRAVLVREEDARGVPAAGVEVEHRDPNGEVFRIRRPANPNETNALIRIFRASNFRRVPTSPDHDLLVALDDTGRVIGGVIFRRPSATFVVLEWIVVSRYRRGRGIGTELLRDFLERLKVQGVRAVSTGFFRPGFFAQFGFGVDPRYAGIVKILADPSASDSGVMPNPLLSAAAPEEARER